MTTNGSSLTLTTTKRFSRSWPKAVLTTHNGWPPIKLHTPLRTSQQLMTGWNIRTSWVPPRLVIMVTLYVSLNKLLNKQWSYWRFHVSNLQQIDCMSNSLLRLTPNKTSKLHIVGHLWGESSGGFPSQRASNAERVTCHEVIMWNIDGLVQERCNSIANALELRLSCTNPSIQYSIRNDKMWTWF